MLYTSAIRCSEVANLRVDDVDLENGYVIVRHGNKYRKDRAVPIGASVCTLLRSYLVGVRAEWRGAHSDAHLFLNQYGVGMRPNAVGTIVRTYSRSAAFTKEGLRAQF